MIHADHLHSERSAKEQEYLDGWQRARAELDNFRRRQEAHSEEDRLRVKKELARGLLSLADNFEAIVSHRPDNLLDNPWAEGVLHVARQLRQVLEDFEVKPIKAEGRPFDPAHHDAVGSVKQAKTAPGQVVEVVQSGYTFRGEVLRPAKVKVAQ
jgi:molecular chaperone GrpE